MENEINLENEKNQLFVERLKKKTNDMCRSWTNQRNKRSECIHLFLKFRWKMEMQDVDDKI